MTLLLLHYAEIEFWESVKYYENLTPGLGIAFKHEVDLFLQRIAVNPLLPRLRKQRYRRVNLSVFQHYIAYIIRDDILWIVAICHAYRKPEFWLDRLD